MSKFVLKYRVKLQSPLIICANKNGNFLETIDYIPGSSIRGAVAVALAENEYGKDEKKFMDAFAGRAVSFTNMYYNGGETMFSREVYPIPSTVMKCKRKNNYFKANDYNEPSAVFHGINDYSIFFAWTKYLINNKLLDGYQKAGILFECPEKNCGEPLETETGYYMLHGDNPCIKAKLPSKKVFTSTGIENKTGISKEGVLFSKVVIEPGQSFAGSMSSDDKDLLEFLKSALNGKQVSLGAYKSTGHGSLIIEFDDNGVRDNKQKNDEFRRNFEEFNNIKEIEKKIGAAFGSKDKNEYLFSISLVSDAIIIDEFLNHKTTLDEPFISKLLEVEPGHLKKVFESSALTPVFGWNSKANFYKHEDVAIKKGSVFAYSIKLDNESKIPEFISRAAALSLKGIGERKCEGYGIIDFCKRLKFKLL